MPGPDCTHHLVAGLTGSCAGLEALVIFAEREDRSVIASMTALVPTCDREIVIDACALFWDEHNPGEGEANNRRYFEH
jgi:hypothetical protein